MSQSCQRASGFPALGRAFATGFPELDAAGKALGAASGFPALLALAVVSTWSALLDQNFGPDGGIVWIHGIPTSIPPHRRLGTHAFEPPTLCLPV